MRLLETIGYFRVFGEGYENVLRNSIDHCGQPIKDRGCFGLALVIWMLFRLLAPPFGFFFESRPRVPVGEPCQTLRLPHSRQWVGSSGIGRLALTPRQK